jgi:hypothetical protein
MFRRAFATSKNPRRAILYRVGGPEAPLLARIEVNFPDRFSPPVIHLPNEAHTRITVDNVGPVLALLYCVEVGGRELY